MRRRDARKVGASFVLHRGQQALRLVVCGGGASGKSILAARLADVGGILVDDEPPAHNRKSPCCMAQAEDVDLLAFFGDAPVACADDAAADVALSHATGKRRIIVADAPGHEGHIRHLAAAASRADLAVIVIDAREGLHTQLRRSTRVVALMGVRHIVLAVNKIDLVGFDSQAFDRIVADYSAFAAAFGFSSLEAIPLSGLTGDNVTAKSAATPWYSGPSLKDYLDTIDVSDTDGCRAFRMAVQHVDQPKHGSYGYCGRILAGEVRTDDAIRVLPSGVTTRIKSILKGTDEVHLAQAGSFATLILMDDIDVNRGDVLAAAAAPPECADQFEGRLLWFSDHAMAPGRQYLITLGAKSATATITGLKYREDVDTGAHLSAKTLAMNDIGRATISIGASLPFEPYSVSRALGGFVLSDSLTKETVGAGTIDFALRRAHNIHWQAVGVGPSSRAAQKGQRPQCIWFTGLSGAGKSTIANLLDQRLSAAGRHTYLLDGDNVRHGLNRDLGFTEEDRVENIRRIAEVAKLMVDAGLIVLVSFISPFRAERRMARALFSEGAFKEIFVDAPVEECERRDAKGLYALARQGKLINFTGVDSPYEPPEAPEAHIRTVGRDPEQCVEQIIGIIEL